MRRVSVRVEHRLTIGGGRLEWTRPGVSTANDDVTLDLSQLVRVAAHHDSSVAAEIGRLQGLRTSGAISDEEFQRAKEKVLA